MKTKIFGGLLIAVLAVTSAAKAQTRTPIVTQRQHNQEARIHQGVRSGQLTRGEANRLQHSEQRLHIQKHIAKSNGYVSPAERHRLQRHENRLSRNIYHKKHNSRRY